MRLIIIRDGARAIFSRPSLVNNLKIGDNGADRTGKRQCAINNMRRKITHIAIGAPIGSPIGWRARIGEKIFRLLATKISDVADLSGLNDIARVLI